jgi:arylsulfatase A-like enzyme
MPMRFSAVIRLLGLTVALAWRAMKLRFFLRWYSIAAGLLLVTVTASTAAETGRRPNVVILLADDLGYGDLACYGHPKFKTPNLDRMAAEGARLTQFNTPAPFCAPTRASLMTGRYPFHCGLTANPAPDIGGQFANLGLPTSEITLAQLFHNAGYATGMVGKWHLGHAKKEFYPVRRGFDEYLGILYSNDMRPVQLIDGEEVAEYPVVQATLTKRYTDRALNFIERNKDKQFFFYFAHAMPHKPLAASEKYYQKSGAGLYGDVISELDASVGRVLAKLKELKLDDNTLVVFTSDNGPWFGGSTGGLRGMKGTSWEGGYRVPFIARWPGTIPAGHVSNQPAVMMDLFSTALAVGGIAAPADRVIDGADIRPLLTWDAKSPHDVVIGSQGPRLATVRDARWKLHVLAANDHILKTPPNGRWIDPRAPDGVTLLAPYEQYQPSDFPGVTTGDSPTAMALFDLSTDPSEQHNVAVANPDIVKRLKAQYDTVAKDLPAELKSPIEARKKPKR